ncbi:MAG TPA: hypothetical protein VGB64_05175 [Actinomycetota bacterium]
MADPIEIARAFLDAYRTREAHAGLTDVSPAADWSEHEGKIEIGIERSVPFEIGEGQVADDPNEWAEDAVFDAIESSASAGLELLIQLAQLAENDNERAYIAASVLEDLLAFQGKQVLERLEQSPEQTVTIKSLFPYVWPSRLSPATRARFRRIMSDEA